jgi:hypothetical protein
MLLRGLFVACVVSLAACASAGSQVGDDDQTDARLVSLDAAQADARIDAPGPPIDAPGPPIDAPDLPIDAPGLPIDAPAQPIDAPITQTITLSQSSTTTITTLNSVGCVDMFGATAENSYYRVFRLTDFGVNTPFTATRFDFGLEQADSVFGTQSLQVRLYTLTSTFILTNLTLLKSQIVPVANQALVNVQVPLTGVGVAGAGATIVAEVFVPDGQAFGDILFLGSNAAPETGPSYIRAPDCGALQPAPIASLIPATQMVRYIITVTGTY